VSGIPAAAFIEGTALEDPYPLLAELRRLGPLCALQGVRAFFVGRHAAVLEAVARPADFSSRLTGVLMQDGHGGVRVFEFPADRLAGDVIATADDPEHAVQRRLLMPSLKATRIAALEPLLRAFARERIAAFVRAGGGDWCDALAEPLPAYTVALLLGLDAAETDRVRHWAMLGGDLLAGRLDGARMQMLLAETDAMHAFLAAHFSALATRPSAERGSSLTAVLAEGVEAGALSRAQAIGILVILFGAAGESTAALIGSALRLLLGVPGLQAALRADSSRIPAFVEEAIRLESPFKFHYRVVTRDTALCGTPLRAGDRLLLGWGSANRDASVFEDADSLRLDRPQPERHLGFGHGIHFCIGAPLARLEAIVALEELLAATRELALDPRTAPTHVPSILVRRLQQLRVHAA
jgi:cytochrome P450